MGSLVGLAKKKAQQKLKVAKQLVDATRSRQATLDRAVLAFQQPVLKNATSLAKDLPSRPVKPPPVPSHLAAYVYRKDEPSRQVQQSLRERVHQQPQLSTTLRRIPQQPRTVTIPRRRQNLKAARPAYRLNTSKFGTVQSLWPLLGIGQAASQPAVLIAIDTESERQGLMNHVVEVGITILDTREIQGLEPGDFLRNWTSRLRHHHFVLDVTRKPKYRMNLNPSFFGLSEFVSPVHAKSSLKTILRDCIAPKESPITADHDTEDSFTDANVPPQVFLVGHSTASDILALRGRPLNTNLLDPSDTGLTFSAVYDTSALTRLAKTELKSRQLSGIPSGKLGPLAAFLGADPQYLCKETPGNVIGTHNASNDAAYTMMALLLYASRWERILAGEGQIGAMSESPVTRQHPKKAGVRYYHTLWSQGWFAKRAMVCAVVCVTFGVVEVALYTESFL